MKGQSQNLPRQVRVLAWVEPQQHRHAKAGAGGNDESSDGLASVDWERVRRHGVYGCCYAHGSLGAPASSRGSIEQLRARLPEGMPFCLCWTRPGDDEDIVAAALPLLTDPRYLRIDGRPILLIRDLSHCRDALAATAAWRASGAKGHLSGVHLCAVEGLGTEPPRALGFDSALVSTPATATRIAPPSLTFDLVRLTCDQDRPDGEGRARVPALEYELRLRDSICWASQNPSDEERLVFVDGITDVCADEPGLGDRADVRGYLEATLRALNGRTEWRLALGELRRNPKLAEEMRAIFCDDLEATLLAFERSTSTLAKWQALIDQAAIAVQNTSFSERIPLVLRGKIAGLTGRIVIDSLCGLPFAACGVIPRAEPAPIRGWAVAEGLSLADAETVSFLVLRRREGVGAAYFAPLFYRVTREDVASSLPNVDAAFTKMSGFTATMRMDDVAPGTYLVGVLHASRQRVAGAFHPTPLAIG